MKNIIPFVKLCVLQVHQEPGFTILSKICLSNLLDLPLFPLVGDYVYYIHFVSGFSCFTWIYFVWLIWCFFASGFYCYSTKAFWSGLLMVHTGALSFRFMTFSLMAPFLNNYVITYIYRIQAHRKAVPLSQGKRLWRVGLQENNKGSAPIVVTIPMGRRDRVDAHKVDVLCD